MWKERVIPQKKSFCMAFKYMGRGKKYHFPAPIYINKVFKEIKISVSSNSFRRCLFQLHYSHKANTTKTYTTYIYIYIYL